MWLNRFKLTRTSTLAEFSKTFDAHYESLVKVHAYKKTFIDEELVPSVNRKKIVDLMDLSAVISKKIRESTLIQDLHAYYSASEEKQKTMSPPVNGSANLKTLILNKDTHEQKIQALTTYYVEYFSKKPITEIIQDGYTVGQRNDLATAITHALPHDSYQRHMFDQFYQLGESLRAVKARVEKARSEGVLDSDFMSTQISNLQDVAPQIHFLCTPEDESASRLSVLLEITMRQFGAEEHQDFVKILRSDIRTLADGSSSFQQQCDIIQNFKEKITLRSRLDQDLKIRLLDLIEQARKQVKVPSSPEDLKALEVISQLRAKLVEYRAQHTQSAVTQQLAPPQQSARRLSVGRMMDNVKVAIGRDAESKNICLDAAVNLLNKYVDEIRDQKLSAASVLSLHGDRVEGIQQVTNLHQLMYWIQMKMPVTSSLPNELMSTFESLTHQSTAQPEAYITPASSSSTSSSSSSSSSSAMDLSVPSGKDEPLWVMVLNDFTEHNIKKTFTRLVLEYSGIQLGKEASELIEEMLRKLPKNFEHQISDACSRMGVVTVDDLLSILTPSVKYSSTMRLLLAGSLENEPATVTPYIQILRDMHARAMLRQYELLMDRALFVYENMGKSAEVATFICEILSQMVPFSQMGYAQYDGTSDTVNDYYANFYLDTGDLRLDEINTRLESTVAEPLPKGIHLRDLAFRFNQLVKRTSSKAIKVSLT